MTLAAGTHLGRYEVRAQIGAGGMGEVYLAQDIKLDRNVALKILPADVAAHPARMKRFEREAKAASALNHPNIVTIYEIELIGSVHFIATEFIDGETLRQRMGRAPLKLGEALAIGTQIVGVAYEMTGSFQEAILEYQKARQLNDDPWVLALLGHVSTATGRRDEALKILDELSRSRSSGLFTPTALRSSTRD